MARQPPTRAEAQRRQAVAAAVLCAFVAVGTAAEDRVSPPAAARHRHTTSRSAKPHHRHHQHHRVTAVDRVLRRTPYITHGGRRGKLVALTFDDGPSPYTHRVVTELRRLHARATFFQVGEMMAAHPGATRMVRRSFPVGDHTLSHPQMATLRLPSQRAQVLAQARRMRAFGERRPRLFRPPYASFDRRTLAVLRRQRMLMVLWSVDSADYALPGVRAIERNVLSQVRPGAIVLMHDGGGPRAQTAAALPRIVRRLRARGYRLVTVPQMLRLAPPPRQPLLRRRPSGELLPGRTPSPPPHSPHRPEPHGVFGSQPTGGGSWLTGRRVTGTRSSSHPSSPN